jgi:hypothetical protein
MVFASSILFMVLVEWGLWRFGKARPRSFTLVACAVVASLAVAFIPFHGPPPDKVRFQRGSVEALEWIGQHVPADARMVASRRTAGTFDATVGRVSVTEGMTPFLRPAMLKPVVDLLIQARHFFHFPVTNRRFLVEQRVSYVLFIKGNALGSQSRLLGDPDEERLQAAPFLRLVYRGPAADVFQFTGR